MRAQLSGGPKSLRLEFEEPILNRPPGDRSPHSDLNKIIPSSAIYSAFTGIAEKDTLVNWFEYDLLGNSKIPEFGLKIILWSETQSRFLLYSHPYKDGGQGLDIGQYSENGSWRVVGNYFEPGF